MFNTTQKKNKLIVATQLKKEFKLLQHNSKKEFKLILSCNTTQKRIQTDFEFQHNWKKNSNWFWLSTQLQKKSNL